MDSKGWHERFLVQARWTEQLRQFLYSQIGLNAHSRILETGCGTGVIMSELEKKVETPVFGIDLDLNRLSSAKTIDPNLNLPCADVYHLPFPDQCFDFVFAHYLFLWLKNPSEAAAEIKRVLRPGGMLVAMAEPDHLARIDYPKELWELGELQTRSLINQGANPMMGRMLPQVFAEAGYQDVQYGLSGFQEQPASMPDWFDSEWKTLRRDLHEESSENLDQLYQLDKNARQKGTRVLWVPTFYAFGIRIY